MKMSMNNPEHLLAAYRLLQSLRTNNPQYVANDNVEALVASHLTERGFIGFSGAWKLTNLGRTYADRIDRAIGNLLDFDWDQPEMKR